MLIIQSGTGKDTLNGCLKLQKEPGLYSETWLYHFLALPLPGCVMGKLLSFSQPPFLHIETERI